MSIDSDTIYKKLPGDELIPSARKVITHAVTINASSKMVWPWLVQLGAGRAGWYSYDRIDNGGTPSAKTIIPELQHVKVGDIFPAVPGSKDSFIVYGVYPGEALVLVVPVKSANEDPDTLNRMMGPLRVSWTLFLKALRNGKTRLISRARISPDWLKASPGASHLSKRPIFIERVYGLLSRMPWRVMVPIAMAGHYIMESRMLHGIRWRAEALTRDKQT